MERRSICCQILLMPPRSRRRRRRRRRHRTRQHQYNCPLEKLRPSMASVSVNCSTMNFLRGATELLSGALKSECAPPPANTKIRTQICTRTKIKKRMPDCFHLRLIPPLHSHLSFFLQSLSSPTPPPLPTSGGPAVCADIGKMQYKLDRCTQNPQTLDPKP